MRVIRFASIDQTNNNNKVRKCHTQYLHVTRYSEWRPPAKNIQPSRWNSKKIIIKKHNNNNARWRCVHRLRPKTMCTLRISPPHSHPALSLQRGASQHRIGLVIWSWPASVFFQMTKTAALRHADGQRPAWHFVVVYTLARELDCSLLVSTFHTHTHTHNGPAQHTSHCAPCGNENNASVSQHRKVALTSIYKMPCRCGMLV